MRGNWQSHLALLIVALIYGANYNIAKSVMPVYLQPFGFIALRVTGGLFLFVLTHRAFYREKIANAKDYGYLALCGLFGVAINQLAFFKGLSLTSPVNASVIMTLSPVVVLLFSAVYLKEQITKVKALGVLFGGIGAALLIGGKDLGFSGETVLGDLLILLNATSYAIYLVLVKPMMARYQPVTVVRWVFTFGWLMVLPFGIEELSEVSFSVLPVSAWMAIAYVIAATTFAAYLLNAWAMKKVSSSIVGFYIYMQPVVATVITITLGHDELTLQKVLFSILIFLGTYLVSKR